METLFYEFTFLATFLNVRKQGAQIWRVGPSPGHGPEHWHSTELAPAQGDRAAVWLGPACKGWPPSSPG